MSARKLLLGAALTALLSGPAGAENPQMAWSKAGSVLADYTRDTARCRIVMLQTVPAPSVPDDSGDGLIGAIFHARKMEIETKAMAQMMNAVFHDCMVSLGWYEHPSRSQ